METVVLERFKHGVELRLQERGLVGQADIWVDPLSDVLVAALEAVIYGKRLGRIVCKRPVNWWQHFKLEVFPDWLLRIAPVDFEIVEYDISQLFPGVRVPRQSGFVRVETLDFVVSEGTFNTFDSRYDFSEVVRND